MKTSFYQYSFEGLANLLNENNLASSGATLLYNWHYKQKKIDECTHNLAHSTQAFIRDNLSFILPKIVETHQAEDQTVKFLIELEDGEKVETVLIAFQNKYTICLSTQVGCAMKCSFCFTGTQGLKRHLKTEEIIGQFIIADRWLKENRPNDQQLKNIVFMGQGEPLHNFDAVKTACEIFLDQHGTSIGIQKITVSTAGYLPGLMRWNAEMPGVNIALSFHSPFEEKRNKLIPINQRYPLGEVLKYLDSIPLKRKQYIIYEYLLIKNYNDTEVDAHATGTLLQSKQAIINLIPFNPFPGSEYERPEQVQVALFQNILKSYNLPALIRGTKGDDILAACGQLNTKNKL
ncbi:MAG: 23S rRNA (adenine(2503)-C(2))-methyltransferase RlmN [Bacteriovorax sp.]|nr:23S rRNA (adenine(2503)-C(2))-methyltransferase RlmN [Bacteriovorax sp.]